MTARLSLYQKAEQELYKLDRSVKATFYDFCHRFRENPDHPGLDLKPLQGDGRVFRAKIDRSYRALLARAGIDERGQENWLVIAVRHRKDVYEELSVAVNRITGEIEFVDLAVVGQSLLSRAGITLTPAEPDAPTRATAARPPFGIATPLLRGITADDLRGLGVSEALIDLALVLTDSEELDQLVAGAPLLSQDILYGLAAGMGVDEVRKEITSEVEVELGNDYAEDLGAALARTTVTTVDLDIRAVIEEGDFRTWKVFLHPSQAKLVTRRYNGAARVSGGPGTGKTIVALHRVKHLAQMLPPGNDKAILLTTFTKNLTTDLRARLASLLEPELMSRVEVSHIDQLAARVLSENVGGDQRKQRIVDSAALTILRQLLMEIDHSQWDAEFLIEEWDQVVLGQSLNSRQAYFSARRAGRGRSLTRPERNQIWTLLEQFTTRLDKEGVETWGQAAERAARQEMERAATIAARRNGPAHDDLKSRDDSSGMRYASYRYRHVVVDEAQDLRASHWKMLRAMVTPGSNDMFIAGDTYQRIYDHHVTLGALGISIRGRSSRLTLSYRTTREILARAIAIVSPTASTYDDLDDGTDTLDGYRSILRGPAPVLVACRSWDDELGQLAATVHQWRSAIATDANTTHRSSGLIAVCVAERDMVDQVINHLAAAHITSAELTKDGLRGNGEIHVGTMHRFKGLEYQRLAIVGVRDGVVPRMSINRFSTTDPRRYAREERKARSLLFMTVTRARDSLWISWHGTPSPYLSDRLL